MWCSSLGLQPVMVISIVLTGAMSVPLEKTAKELEESNLLDEDIALTGCINPRIVVPDNLMTYVQDGGNIYVTDCQGRSAMHIAILNGDEETILNLLERKFDLNKVFKDGSTILQFAIANKYDMVQRLVKLGADFNQKFGPQRKTYLHKAATEGEFRLMLRLIELGTGVDAVDKDDNTALTIAVKKNEPALVNLLVASGANFTGLTKSNESFLHLAVKSNCTTCLRRLLDGGLPADARDSNGNTPIMLAIGLDNTASSSALAEGGADLKQVWGPSKSTLLHWAANKRSRNSIKWLLSQGLSVDSRNTEGITPIQQAIAEDDPSTAAVFAASGADLKQVWGPYDATLLHWAARTDSVAAIAWLVKDLGIGVNTIIKEGNTPLHYAAFWGKIRAVKVLVNLGACLDCRDDFGRTALYWANHYAHKDVIEYFKSKGVTY